MGAPGVEYPLRLDASGRAARAPSLTVATEQLIEQALFTELGSRLNRPELGCGLLELVFDVASDELRAATQFQASSALQRWLGDVIRVIAVTATTRSGVLEVTVQYALPDDGVTRTAVFTR